MFLCRQLLMKETEGRLLLWRINVTEKTHKIKYIKRGSDIVVVTGWKVRGSNPGRGHASPDRPWCPPSLIYNVYRDTIPGLKRSGRVDHALHKGL